MNLDGVNGFSRKRQVLSAALFLHETTHADLEQRLGKPLQPMTTYDTIKHYGVKIEDWTLDLTFVGAGPVMLRDVMGRHGAESTLYTWKHVPIAILTTLADLLGAEEQAVRTRFHS